MKRPSRGLLWTLFAALLLCAAAFGLWTRSRAPNRWAAPPPADVWMLEGGTPGDIRTSPDGPPPVEVVCVGVGETAIGGRRRTPFVAIVPKGQQTPTALQRLRDRVAGDPLGHMKYEDRRNLYRADADPVDTPSGRWWRYSTRWWKGANPPTAGGR